MAVTGNTWKDDGWRSIHAWIQHRRRIGRHPMADMMVRRITPTEAERLMGLPDGYTAVPYRGKTMADGPRYRLLGNSIAVNCLSWIGQRIALFEEVTHD